MSETTDQKKDIKNDIALFTSREALARSEGGKQLIKILKGDLLGDMNWLSANYKSGAEVELRGRLASFAKSLSLYRLLADAQSQKQLAIKALDKILEQDPDDEEDDR